MKIFIYMKPNEMMHFDVKYCIVYYLDVVGGLSKNR